MTEDRGSAAAQTHRGNDLLQRGRHEEALASYDDALAFAPGNIDALSNRGVALLALRRYEEALASFDRAIACKPDFPEALNNRGVALEHLGRHEDALASYDRALTLKADYAEAHNNHGNALRRLARYQEALASYERALALKPTYAEALNNLGIALHELRRYGEAAIACERALALKPDYAEAVNNLGNALRALGRHEEALASYAHALTLKPNYADAYNNLGSALEGEGRVDEAIACYRKALAIDPDRAAIHHALIHALNRTVPDGAEVFAECIEFAERFERNVRRLPHHNSRDPERRLKVGYVSGDFRQHSIAHYIEPVLANHDHDAVEVFCYSNHRGTDHVTQKLMRHADHWRCVAGISDDRLAALVQQDGIDLLVDLSGHTAHSRLLAFARKPAPVQITWLGMPGTTGLSAIDYRLTNHYLDPVGMTERYHTETLVRLSASSCFQPAPGLPPVSALPALANGYVTFASFNDFNKVSPAVLTTWSAILAALPKSRLMMICPAHAREAARRAFSAHGIDAQRLTFSDKRPLIEYLALHNQVDIALDPFPYNGGTITRHALWMGVPVICIEGSRPVSRVGFALMSQVGLHAFVAGTVEEYVQIALRWARDPQELAEIRTTLRQRVQNAPFSNVGAQTRELEAVYRRMWREWCA